MEKKFLNGGTDYYRDRFQFIVWIDDNIICQRYFSVKRFSKESLCSIELKETIDDIVATIDEDLRDKSVTYLWLTENYDRIKLTGFVEGEESTYLYYDDKKQTDRQYHSDKPEPWGVTFKFSLLIDDIPVCERIWDGSVYPKFVRNNVDITNNDSFYKGRDISELGTTATIMKYMVMGKEDLTKKIIRKLSNIMDSSYVDNYGYYTTKATFTTSEGKKTVYNLSSSRI